MGYPGWIVNPNGSKLFVLDKVAYFQQHPKTYWETVKSIESLDYLKDQAKATEDKRERERAESKKMPPRQDSKFETHECTAGQVLRTCDKCNGVNHALVCWKFVVLKCIAADPLL